MKEKIKKRIKGSISIFLVIIMVPMMCLSGLIVDGSRVELAKASISSAGDLTMNSALANYDTVLKDVYGLFAMSQTAKDLEENLYSYFVDTLMANGITTSEEEVQNNPLLQDIANAFSGQTSNMLSMEIEKDDFTATKLENSSLANPYILKNQIVEYQKYRAPVSSALSLLDGIASLKKILNQSNVNKAKTTVDEKSGELNKNGNSLYEALKKYDEKSESYDPTYSTFSFRGEIITHKQAYEKYIIKEYVRYIAESMPYSVEMKKNNTGAYTFYFDIEYLEYTRGKDNSQWLRYTGKTTDELLKELMYAYECFENGIIQDSASILIQTTDVSTLSLRDKQSYATAYKMYMQKVYNLKNFYDAYIGQYNAEEDDITFISAHEQDILDIFEKAVKFTKVLNAYETTVESAKNLADDAIYALNSDLIQKIGWFSEVDILLTNAIEAIGELETTITDLDSANNTLKKEIDAYNGSDVADAFSKQMQADYEYYKDSIDPVKVAALKSKLENLKTYFVDVEKYLKSITFAGLAGYDDSSNSLSNLVTMTRNKNTTTGAKNVDYINDHVSDELSGLTTFYKTQYSEGTKPSPQSVSIKEDEFYKYLKQAYVVEPTNEDLKAKDQKAELQKNAKSVDSDGTISSYNQVVVSEEIKQLLPSQGEFQLPNGVEGYDGSDNFSGLFERITVAVNDLIAGIEKAAKEGRDNLYVTQYVFDMFSYNTMEAEYKVENNVSSGEMSKSLDELGLKLETSSGIKKSATNNFMYGAEVEYVLYGGFDAKSNISTAKTNIFCIRFLANSAYALTNSEIRSITLPPALAVQAATMGVVPYKLTQVVLQLCLALGESANDIRLMEKGEKVALIKTRDTWKLDSGIALDFAKEEAKDVINSAINDTADKVKGVVSDLIDAGTEKIEVRATDFITDMTEAINGQAEELIGNMFSTFEEEVIASLDSFLKQGKKAVGNVDSTAQAVIDSADAKAREIIGSSSDTVRPILQSFYDLYLSPKLDIVKSDIKTALNSIENNESIEDGSTILLNVQIKIATMIQDSLTHLSEYVEGQTRTIVNELRNRLITTTDGYYIDMAANEILDVTNNFLDETFNSISSQLPDIAGKPSNNSSLASIIKFNYGDYLKMFVFLKLCVDDVDVISRIADVIQLNINQALTDSGYTHPIKGSFLMSEAYTYIQTDAKVKLKTMFISLPFFTEYSEKGRSYFTIDYKSVLGY